MLNFLKKFSIFCFLDNHQYDFDKSYDCIAGAGSLHVFKSTASNSFKGIDEFSYKNKDWIFGNVSYDLKNEIENLTSSHSDFIQFPDYFFFVPEIVFLVNDLELKIGINGSSLKAYKIFALILSSETFDVKENPQPVTLKSRFGKEDYIDTIIQLQKHLHKGDCYEINFCQEFYCENITINPINVFKKLNHISPNPFAALYKLHDKYLICASPERFLKKTGNKIISQPMKGTAKRFADNIKDHNSLQQLYANNKERSENIMIVDLVRNDLSKICEEGSVSVKDFLKTFSFPNVHQMISTVEGALKNNISLSEIFYAMFPMGSMTGAPKKRVMELIEKYERTKRGLFSGTVGYISPEKDFDFNVVIRSILYNEKNKFVSVQAGSAITVKSNAEEEYEECLLKVEVMKNALCE